MEDTLPVTMTFSAGLETDSFDDLVREHQASVYRLLWCELRDSDAAATLTQECFLRVYRSRASFRGECSVRTWLMRVALNLARDHQRSRRQGFWRKLFSASAPDPDAIAGTLAAPLPSPERTLIARQELQRVMQAVSSLPERQRTVFLLRFVEEFSLDEIAIAMSVEIGTVKAHLSRGVATVRQTMRGRK
jgi:RNA polymerase sigma-70 factor (ECF subfamily)